MKATTLAIVYVLSIIVSWLLFSIIWDFFNTNHNYIEVLRQPEQGFGLLFLYWWFPGVFILDDLLKDS
mgnify:CR=1 FL=1